ncbi:MAG TPA: hypothetical protein VGB18_00780 [Candidatus Thermoplasmatota archaeon]
MSLPGFVLIVHLAIQPLHLAAEGASQDAADAGIDIADPAHDVRPSGATTPAGAPGAGPTGPQDLLRFRVYDEDAEGIEFELYVADMNAPGAFTTVDHVVSFNLAGTSTTYRLTWEAFTPLAAATLTGPASVPAEFCYRPNGDECFAQRIIATKNWDTSTLWARVSKDALMGKDPKPGPASVTAPPLAKGGSQLEEFFVISQDADAATTDTDAGALFDRVPDQGVAGPLLLTFPIVPSGLRVRVEPMSLYGEDTGLASRFPVVPVTPGVVSTARLRIHNDDLVPHIVNLSFDFLRDGPRDEWGVRLVPTLKIPASSSRLVNVIFDPGAVMSFETKQLMTVSAKSLTANGIVSAAAFEIIVAAAPPGPAKRDLFLHLTYTTLALAQSFDQICRIPFCGGVGGWMNTERTQAAATGDPGRVWGYDVTFGFPTSQTYSLGHFELDYAPVHDLVIQQSGNVELTLRIQSEAPMTGTLTSTVTTHGELLATGSKDVSVTGTQDIVLSMPIALTSDRIPAGSNITLDFILVHDEATVAAFAATPPQFIAGGSKLNIPFIEDPAPKDRIIPAGPAVLGLSTSDAREAFLNPGNTTLFNATVVNEGILEDIVHLEATTDSKNWTTRLVPATDFRLQPGESAVVGLYVTAPKQATEGDQVKLELVATSSADASARASIGLVATVILGVEIADQADTYQTDEDTEKHRVVSSNQRTPGLSIPAAIAALAATLFLARIRRRHAP